MTLSTCIIIIESFYILLHFKVITLYWIKYLKIKETGFCVLILINITLHSTLQKHIRIPGYI